MRGTVAGWAAVVGAGACAAAGCGAGTPPGGDTLVVARGADARTLDPGDATDGESIVVTTQLYETLVTSSATGTDPVPCLATAWTASEDGLHWTFTLRPGVRFHDGTACDAAAVKAALDRLTDRTHPGRHGGAFAMAREYAGIASVEAPDPGTVVIRLREPSAVLLGVLGLWPAGVPSPTALRERGEGFARAPVGTGPYRFVEWRPGERIVCERWEGYWGTPAVTRRIVFVPIAEQAARLERLRRGEAHVMTDVDFGLLPQIRSDPELRWIEAPGTNVGYLACNVTRAPFDDVRVRRAVAHALDRDQLLALGYAGTGQVATTLVAPTIPGRHDGIAGYAHDPARARALLAEAGFPDGIDTDLWAMPNARPYMPRPRDCAQVVQRQLADAGIRARIVSPPWSEYLAKTGEGAHPMCLLGWTSPMGDPDNVLGVLCSARGAMPPAALNRAFWRDDAVQDLLDRGRRARDPAARWPLYRDVQARAHDACAFIPLVHAPVGVALRREVQDYPLHQAGIVRLWRVRVGTP